MSNGEWSRSGPPAPWCNVPFAALASANVDGTQRELMPQTYDVTPVEIRPLGIQVTPVQKRDILSHIRTNADSGPSTIAAHNLHSVYVLHTNPDFRTFYDHADLTVVDGWPILAALNGHRRRLGVPALPNDFRIGSTDWILDAIALQEVESVCILGASQASNASFVRRVSESMPHKTILGIPGFPWNEIHQAEALDRVVAFDPDLVLIGMGMPLQEGVAIRLRDKLNAGVIATVGGAIDQLSGAQAHAPRWTGRLRVEWLWRLASDPRRLAHRYLIEPVKLAAILLQRRTRPIK